MSLINVDGEGDMGNPHVAPWPLDASRRRALCVLDVDDIEDLMYEPGFDSLWLNKEVHVLQLPLPENDPVPRSVGSRARRGDVLIQNPYNENVYEPATTAPTQFAREKLRYVSQLCQFLGARKVSVLEVVEHERSEESEVSGELGGSVGPYGSGEVGGKYGSSFSAMEALTRSIADEFEGGRPDIAEAENLLMRTGLSGDPDVRALLELRNNQRNVMTSSRAELNLVRETRRNVDVLAHANLEVLSAVGLSVELGWKRDVRALSRYKFRIEVDF